MGTLQGYVPKSFNSFRVYAFAMYQMCRFFFVVAGSLGVLPQENLEIWSALGAILGLLRVSS